MPGLTTTVADAVLKEGYQGPVRDQINRKAFLTDKVRTNKTVAYHGKRSYIPVSVGFNAGTGPRAESAALPAAGAQEYSYSYWYQKSLYGRIQVTGQAISHMRSDKGAFVRAIKSEMDGLISNCSQMTNRMLWHDGGGLLTGCATTSASATVNVASTKHIFKGMEVILETDGAIASHATETNLWAAKKRVLTVPSSTTFTVSSTCTTSTSQYVALADTLTSTSSAPDVWGLEMIVSDGANPDGVSLAGIDELFGGIDRSSAVYWKANMLGNSGTNRDLSLDLMQQAYDESEIQGDSKPGAILTNYAMKRRYAALLIADRRYPGTETPFDGDGGWRGLEFNDGLVMADKDAGKSNDPSTLNAMYFVTMSGLERHVSSDWEWMQEDGAILSRVSGYDAYEAVYRTYFQLACPRPNVHTKLYDLSES